jgi:hypothetical protein
MLGQMRPDRDEHRVEPSLGTLGGQVGDPVTAGQPHAQHTKPGHLARQHVPGSRYAGMP